MLLSCLEPGDLVLVNTARIKRSQLLLRECDMEYVMTAATVTYDTLDEQMAVVIGRIETVYGMLSVFYIENCVVGMLDTEHNVAIKRIVRATLCIT